MSIAWTLYDGTDTKTLAEWGIEAPALRRLNLGVETLTFAIPTNDINAAPAFAWDQQLVLLRDDVPYFIGRVTSLPAAFSAERERQIYVVSNNWQLLQTSIYQQQYVIPDEDATAKLGSWSSRVVLGKDQWGKKLTTENVIKKVGAYANKIGCAVTFSVDLPSSAIPPMETVRDITCAEAIRRMVAYTPDAVGWFDYSTGATVLRIWRRSALTAVDLDLNDADHVEVIEGLDALYEVKPRGVVLVFLTIEPSDTGDLLRETRQVAGASTGPRVIFATINLAPGEAVPSGLASYYYGALSTLQWGGTIRFRESDVSSLLRPGRTVNLINGRTAWATAYATIQSSTEELLTGITTAELGMPDHLGLSDFVDMMRRFRERPNAGDFANSQDNGTEGPDDQVDDTDPSPDTESPASEDPDTGGNQGGDPDTDPEERAPNPSSGVPIAYSYVEIEYCREGSPRIARVLGVDAGPPGGGGGPPPPL